MAGKVLVDTLRVPASSVEHLCARECPVTKRYGEVCQQYDPHTGLVEWCPFMYGLRIRVGKWHRGEVRDQAAAAHWMATEDYGEPRQYQVLCLRQTSELTEVGATVRA